MKFDDRKINIASQEDYETTMRRILELMKVGESALTEEQLQELRALSLAANAYEKSQYTVPPPTTLEGLVEMKMYEQKLKQKDLARLFEMAESKVSEILNKKRPADVAFLKAAHERLGIDGNLLLDYV